MTPDAPPAHHSPRLISQARSTLGGAMILLLATALWGASAVVIKVIEQSVTPAATILIRFIIAAILLLPFFRRDWRLWRAGLELGAWLFVACISQAIALRYTTVNRSTFIIALNVIFVPLMAAGFGRRIRPLIWLAAITALIGCGLLCYDANGAGPNRGDWWSLLCAFTYAAYILRVEHVAPAFPTVSLALAQFIPIIFLSLAWAAPTWRPIDHAPWGLLLFLGIGCTAATTWLQTLGQKSVPAPQAAVIFTLEPVFAALVGFAALHETLGTRGFIGAAMIVAAAVTSQIPTLITATEPT